MAEILNEFTWNTINITTKNQYDIQNIVNQQKEESNRRSTKFFKRHPHLQKVLTVIIIILLLGGLEACLYFWFSSFTIFQEKGYIVGGVLFILLITYIAIYYLYFIVFLVIHKGKFFQNSLIVFYLNGLHFYATNSIFLVFLLVLSRKIVIMSIHFDMFSKSIFTLLLTNLIFTVKHHYVNVLSINFNFTIFAEKIKECLFIDYA